MGKAKGGDTKIHTWQNMISGLLGSLCSWEAVKGNKERAISLYIIVLLPLSHLPLTQFSPGCNNALRPFNLWNIP